MPVSVGEEMYAYEALASGKMKSRLSSTRRYLTTAQNHTWPMLAPSTCKSTRLQRYG